MRCFCVRRVDAATFLLDVEARLELQNDAVHHGGPGHVLIPEVRFRPEQMAARPVGSDRVDAQRAQPGSARNIVDSLLFDGDEEKVKVGWRCLWGDGLAQLFGDQARQLRAGNAVGVVGFDHHAGCGSKYLLEGCSIAGVHVVFQSAGAGIAAANVSLSMSQGWR